MPEAIDPNTLRFVDGRPQVIVDAETGCWVWQGSRCRGYARVRHGKRGSVQAHRVLWARAYGPIPIGYDLGHTCSRRSCVNPDHVRPVTKQINDAERYEMPKLSRQDREAIEEMLLEDRPNGDVSERFGISIWSVRRIAEQVAWRDQFTLDLDIPF